MSTEDEGASGNTRRPSSSATSTDNGVDKVEAAKRSLWNTAYDSFFRWAAAADNPLGGGGDDRRFYRTEQRMLQQHIEPIYWGAFAGLFLFATLRVSGSNWFARIRHRMQQTGNNTTTTKGKLPVDPKSSSSSPQTTTTWKSHLDKETERHASYAKDLIQLPGDAVLSLLCGMSATLWLSRPTQLCKDIVTAPLLPGKSLVYEHVCPDMVATFQRVVVVDDDDDDDDNNNTLLLANDSTLQHFGALVYNCRQRSRYLEQQQQQRKSGSTVEQQLPGVVPYPGLEGKRIP